MRRERKEKQKEKRRKDIVFYITISASIAQLLSSPIVRFIIKEILNILFN